MLLITNLNLCLFLLLAIQILTPNLPYNYHQSLPRHFGEVRNQHHHHQHQNQYQQMKPCNNNNPYVQHLPTVSASIYDQRRSGNYTQNRNRNLINQTRPMRNDSTLQPPRQFDSYYYHPATLKHKQHDIHPTNTIQSSVHHPTNTSQSSSASSSSASSKPLLPSQNRNSVVYADLEDEGRNNRKRSDYGVLKFIGNNQIGKEIDV